MVDYTDPKINVVSEKKVSDKYTIVNSILEVSKGRPEVKIDWRIYTKNPEKPLIRDLMVEGLSLARTQKEEFNSVIQNNNGDINSIGEGASIASMWKNVIVPLLDFPAFFAFLFLWCILFFMSRKRIR